MRQNPNKRTPAVINAKLSQIYSYITDTIGARVIALPILPRSYYSGFSAAEITQAKADILAVNDWIAAQESDNIITVPAIYAAFEGQTPNEPVSEYVSDGLHPSPAGAKVIGDVLTARMRPLIGGYEAGEWIEGVNLLPNPNFSGTGGSVDTFTNGQVADGMEAVDRENDGLASYRTYSKTPEGYQRIQIQAPQGVGAIGTYFRINRPDLELGASYYAELEIDLVKADGAYKSIFILMDRSSNAGIRHHKTMDHVGTRAQPTFSGVLRTPVCRVAGEIGLDHQVYFELEGDSASGPIDIDAVLKSVRLVKLG
ncbi:MAG: hypothetical protein CBB87_02920 [Micavibrio sp. TMED27]|nr:hypothetical protein [Micavibrio sp.]OUT92273.1 MAG: hypothetical protein CBB87_02920 [Micavibrio sp. TMED27]